MRRSREWKWLRRRALMRDNFECRVCGARNVPLEVDHVVPLARGGADGLDNVQAICKPCHIEKTTREFKASVRHERDWASYVRESRRERRRRNAG